MGYELAELAAHFCSWLRMCQHMGSCQNYGPFWGTLNNRCRTILGTQKGTIILTTTHTYIYIYIYIYMYIYICIYRHTHTHHTHTLFLTSYKTSSIIDVCVCVCLCACVCVCVLVRCSVDFTIINVALGSLGLGI